MKNNDCGGVDQGLFVGIIRSSLEIRHREQLTAWVRNELRILFPHKMMLCCLCQADQSGPKLKSAIGIDWPVEYNGTIVNAEGNVSSPIVARWLMEQRPQLFQPDDGQFEVPPGWLATFMKYDLRNIAAHGVFDSDRRTATYFTFSQIDEKLNERHALLLELLVPHIHQAFVRVVSRERKEVVRKTQRPPNLTHKEIVILQWLAAGKTNMEIATIISRSPCTVRNQIHVILNKLNVVCRAQAVAAAKDMRLLSSNW